eukprot:GHVU01163152.1.p2 GENE.GHVU01163152.1~~GHVU01163152.1.p2  ORF type:complete len:115 (-),score=14.76 GHVU01163152.1:8-352(-)
MDNITGPQCGHALLMLCIEKLQTPDLDHGLSEVIVHAVTECITGRGSPAREQVSPYIVNTREVRDGVGNREDGDLPALQLRNGEGWECCRASSSQEELEAAVVSHHMNSLGSVA